VLEDPNEEPPPLRLPAHRSPEDAPGPRHHGRDRLREGRPGLARRQALSPARCSTALNDLGRDNGIGRLDLVEKPLRRHEEPRHLRDAGGTILHVAHRAIESLTLDREAMHLKDSLMPRYAELVYYGFWFAPEREMIQALADRSQVTWRAPSG
jgi:argininosuccinate synthase